MNKMQDLQVKVVTGMGLFYLLTAKITTVFLRWVRYNSKK